MTTEHLRPISCEDVLMDFATSEQGPTEEALERFVRRFPTYEQPLRDLFAALVAEEAAEWPEAAGEPARGPSLAEQVLRFGASDERQAPSPGKAPFQGSNPEELRRLTRELNVSPLFVAKLKDRVIDAQTMSNSFLGWLAGHLGATTETLRDYFGGEPRMAKGLAFKADDKPHSKAKQSFDEAIETSGLTEEQKRMLRDLG